MYGKLRTVFIRPSIISTLTLVVVGVLLTITIALANVGTSFTYQGQLLDGSGAVNDTCDIQFSLYDAASAGSQVGEYSDQNKHRCERWIVYG